MTRLVVLDRPSIAGRVTSVTLGSRGMSRGGPWPCLLARLVGLLLLASAPAWAGLEAKHYVARRLAADHHLQVKVERVTENGGRCRVEGEILRRFAAKPSLPAGDGIIFALPCAADSFWPRSRLESTPVVEVYLRSIPGGLEAADDGEGMIALDSATDTPASHDDPALVREMSESIAAYTIDTEIKRSNPGGALALARVDDPALRLRLLAHVSAGLAARHAPEAKATGDEILAAYAALAADDTRLDTGLAALETLALGGDRDTALALANLLEPEVDALTLPSRRDDALMVLYGARTRSDDPKAALAALSKVTDPKTRRERLDDMAFAQKDFGAANPASPAWMERLLAAAETQTDMSFRREALTALCRVAYRSAAGLVESPELRPKAIPMAELAAKRHHGPAAVLMAVLTEVGGGGQSRAQAARWYAVAGSGFDMAAGAGAEAIKTLASFTPAERAAAARLLGATVKGPVSPRMLMELTAK